MKHHPDRNEGDMWMADNKGLKQQKRHMTEYLMRKNELVMTSSGTCSK